jgi:hypothetical protein
MATGVSITGAETLASMMTSYGIDGNLLRSINSLTETHDILADMPAREASAIEHDQVERVISLPAPEWLDIGEGKIATFGATQQDTEGIAHMGARYQIKLAYLKQKSNPDQFMQRREALHLEAMYQEAANTFVYGDSGPYPKEFDGLDVRYSALETGIVFNNGGVGGDNGSLTSMWLIVGDTEDCCLIYPKGGQGGLRRIPKGIREYPDETGNTGPNIRRSEYSVTEMEWDIGFCLQDRRRVKRQANIHKTLGNARAWDWKVTVQMINSVRVPGRPVLYCNQDVYDQICIDAADKGNVQWGPADAFGKPVAYIHGVPIRRMNDAITSAENALS